MKNRNLMLGATAACYLILLSNSPGGTVFSDTFTIGTDSRTAGSTLNGANVETGIGTWAAVGAYVFTSQNTLSMNYSDALGPNTSRIANVPVSSSDIIGKTSSVYGNAIQTSSDGNYWAAVGFAKNPEGVYDSNFWTTGVGELWMLINGAGAYQVFANGVNSVLATGTAANFLSGGANQIRLDYNQPDNLVNAYVNGEAVLNNYDLSTGISFTPTIDSVGLHIRGPIGDVPENNFPQFTSFGFNSVPEPSSLVLLALGAAGVAFLRRKALESQSNHP